MLLVVKKKIELIVPRNIEISQSKEMSHDFVRGQSGAKFVQGFVFSDLCLVASSRAYPLWFTCNLVLI